MHNGEWGREGRYLRVVTGVPLIAVSPQGDGFCGVCNGCKGTAMQLLWLERRFAAAFVRCGRAGHSYENDFIDKQKFNCRL